MSVSVHTTFAVTNVIRTNSCSNRVVNEVISCMIYIYLSRFKYTTCSIAKY